MTLSSHSMTDEINWCHKFPFMLTFVWSWHVALRQKYSLPANRRRDISLLAAGKEICVPILCIHLFITIFFISFIILFFLSFILSFFNSFPLFPSFLSVISFLVFIHSFIHSFTLLFLSFIHLIIVWEKMSTFSALSVLWLRMRPCIRRGNVP